MVPDKFNMVDMEGIDILFSYGDIIPGLYQKLVESIAQCRYQCLYNWYFDEILIPPSYVEMTVIDNKVWIGDGISIDEEDTLEFIALGLKNITGVTAHTLLREKLIRLCAMLTRCRVVQAIRLPITLGRSADGRGRILNREGRICIALQHIVVSPEMELQ